MIDLQKISELINQQIKAKNDVKRLIEERSKYQSQFEGIQQKVRELDQKISDAHSNHNGLWKNYIESYIEEQSK